MNRRSRHYHQWVYQALGPITARKKRLLRIRQNRSKRIVGLSSKRRSDISYYSDLQFVGRDSRPISTRAYLRHQADHDYAIIACDWYKAVKVSTVWMGQKWPNGGFHEDDFYLFETMIFAGDGSTDSRRYKTEAEAREGHAFMLAALKKLMNPFVPGKRRSKEQQEIDETYRRLLREVDRRDRRDRRDHFVANNQLFSLKGIQ